MAFPGRPRRATKPVLHCTYEPNFNLNHVNLPAPILAATLWENLLWLAGYNDLRDLPPGGKMQLELTNLPTSWVVFVLIAVILGLLYSIFALYRREMPGCPTWVKMVLATLRAAAMLLLVFILLNPALIYF